jgi:2-oxoglutarate dehydrogenase E1 component
MSESRSRGATAFGANVWLIDEMYRRYLESPDSVGESWREFFADYRPMGQAPSLPARPDPAAPAPEEAAPEKAREEKPGPPAGAEPLRGGAARIVENMERSLALPTATSTRTLPVKLLEENRRAMNQYLVDAIGGKISFTHIIAWAVLKALRDVPAMTASYLEFEGVPHRRLAERINLGVAVDLEKRDGTRTLLVPNIKGAEALDFASFFGAYNALLQRARGGQLAPEDFQDTTVTLTNPGTIGTVQSVPRLMQGQGLIVATGAIAYPAEFQSADPRTIARLGVSKVMTVTSTYDHRVIQGAESGLFLQRLHDCLLGENGFYDEIFAGMKIPYHPVRLTRDENPVFGGAAGAEAEVEKQTRVNQLINMYRVRGHLRAHLSPLSDEPATHAELDPYRYGLSVWDLDREFATGGLGGRQRASFREILDLLREAYCRTVGVEYMHIQEPEQKAWIQRHVEGTHRSGWLDAEQKKRLLIKLNAAEAFERFLHTKYIGHKRFSLEGAETLIPSLDYLLTRALECGIEQVFVGMAHRGRLNVLANILGKSPARIFREFEGDLDPESLEGTGDVKYHLGASGTHQAPGGRTLDIALASNPSHLEAVNPVVEGAARAFQDHRGDAERAKVLPVLIHGDAAFAGQGVVAETLNLSALKGYRSGGALHVVVNNGIGFTTAPVDARSSVYATDVAKTVQAPIFHVNGDDPEACLRVMALALLFRQQFRKDVVVDLVCYRRHGHNESDEPSFTQPIMYSRIEEKRSVRKLYTERLVNRGDLSLEEAEKSLDNYREVLEQIFEETHESRPPEPAIRRRERPAPSPPHLETGVEGEVLAEILGSVTRVPGNFEVHPKLARQLRARGEQLEMDAVDWALAETLAFGSLLLEGLPIRLAGQDSRRGTFSQRHAVLVDHRNAAEYTPLNEIREGQEQLLVYDSLLSEYAALGFEYGYSVVQAHLRQEEGRKSLVLWEAQFGDFVNGAQIIIDQFLSSAEDKWNQKSGLVLLLPHGFEGQGPEHSSARVERFLTLCAAGNMQVAVPTTAAQYFHLLRRQAHMERLKPLVVLTPKSLLRSQAATSHRAEIESGCFRELLSDPEGPERPRRLLLCSGKVAFDLLGHRSAAGAEGTAIVRLEQLYPFPREQVRELLEQSDQLEEICWVQEEPRNMGAWSFVQQRMEGLLPEGRRLAYVGRPASGSPATGSATIHHAEQEQLVRQAFE